MKSELLNGEINQPRMFENGIRDVNARKAYYGERHFKSLNNLAGDVERVHIVYDDTDTCDSPDEGDAHQNVWVSCCGLVKAAEWPVTDQESDLHAPKPVLNRGWKSIDCIGQDIYMTPRRILDAPHFSDSSSVDSLDFDTVVYDVPRKIPNSEVKRVSKSDLFRHKSNPNFLKHRDTDSHYVAMSAGIKRGQSSRAPSDDRFARRVVETVRFPLSPKSNLGRRRTNRFNSTDVISSVSSLSEVEEISTSEENIYMELPETEVGGRKKEAKSKRHKKTKRNIFNGMNPKRNSSQTETTKRFRKDSTGIKKKLTTFLKPRTPLYAKIQNCPPVERALIDRTNVPLPALPATRARASLVEDPYSFIEDRKDENVIYYSSRGSPSALPVKKSDEKSAHSVRCEEGIYESPRCCPKAPEPNFSTHPACKKRFRKSLTLDLDRNNQSEKIEGSMLSPILCCVKPSSAKRVLNIDHMYNEKLNNYDYDVPRALHALSSSKEEYHAATLKKFIPKEVDSRPKEEKMLELDSLLNAIQSFMSTHAISNDTMPFDPKLPFLVTEDNPAYIDPVAFYKTHNIPLRLSGAQVQNSDEKPLYRSVLKKKDRLLNKEKKEQSFSRTDPTSFPSTDPEDDYTLIEDIQLSSMAKRKLFQFAVFIKAPFSNFFAFCSSVTCIHDFCHRC